ncbi:UPF0184 protein C9orf16 homolog [Stegodyphus dumicola]|uniref:UPF0184 protein C9orf16 homolog n=1 Tax=Stegodyphus dumicola TaxID=202533 RepID=UPI0015ACCCEE|nr:UPF0184 protein C9orf16 homolog [Stegodyphus dumicola]
MTAKNKVGEPPEEGSEEIHEGGDDELQDIDTEAYNQLSHDLDEISNCLDALEQKNDNLHKEIYKLLEESKQIRCEIKECASSSAP